MFTEEKQLFGIPSNFTSRVTPKTKGTQPPIWSDANTPKTVRKSLNFQKENEWLSNFHFEWPFFWLFRKYHSKFKVCSNSCHLRRYPEKQVQTKW